MPKKLRPEVTVNEHPVWECARSFQKVVQVQQYQPETFFCSTKEVFFDMPSEEQKSEISEKLYRFCQSEVMRAVAEAKAVNENPKEDEDALPLK